MLRPSPLPTIDLEHVRQAGTQTIHAVAESKLVSIILDGRSASVVRCDRADAPSFSFWFADTSARSCARAAGRELAPQLRCLHFRADAPSPDCSTAAESSSRQAVSKSALKIRSRARQPQIPISDSP